MTAKMAHKITRRAGRIIKRIFTTRSGIICLLVWAVGLAPATYGVTALTTQTPLSDSGQVLSLAKSAGIFNAATWGIYAPLLNAAKSAVGGIASAVGADQIAGDLKSQATLWFDAGKTAATNKADALSKKVTSSLPSVASIADDAKGAPDAAKIPVQLTDNNPTGMAGISTAWDPKTSPDYYKSLGSAVVDYSIAKGKVHYSSLDSLGRTGRVVAAIDWNMVAAEKGKDRPSFEDSADPAGWGSNGIVSIALSGNKTYHGYMFNRSHELAYSLGGDMQRHNLVTGTRTQNVGSNNSSGGMAYTETKARNFLEKNKNCVVYYSVTPIYHGSELLPRATIIDMKSCSGALDERVEVFNAAAGYKINYLTGVYEKQ